MSIFQEGIRGGRKPFRKEKGDPASILGKAKRLQKLLEGAGARPGDPIFSTATTLLMFDREEELGMVESYLAQVGAAKILDERLFPIPEPLEGEGIPLGKLQSGAQFVYPKDDLSTGALMLGATKSGKTTAVCYMVEQLIAAGNGVLIPDLRGDFRPLACSIKDALYVPSEVDRINPLCPPEGVSLKQWIPVITARLTLDLELRTPAMTYLIRKTVKHAEELDGQIPTLISLFEFLKKQNPKRMTSEEGYLERILGRMEALILQIGREVLNVEKGFPVVEEVEKGRLVVLDLRKKDKLVSDFLTTVRLYHLYYKRLVNQNPFGAPLSFVVLDEQRSLIRKQAQDYGIPDIDLLFSRSRALNIGFLVLEQIPSMVSPAVLSACRLRIGFHSSPPEQRIVADILGLNRDQAKELVKLPAGVGIVRYGSDAYPDPFLIQVEQTEWMK